ncbi:MAG: geranylgeranylglycerol-phosphate geranylgeranyltransferase [Bacteroidota bacterium]
MPALLRLLRPVNVVLSLFIVAVGGILAVGATAFDASSLGPLLLAMASGACVGSAANALNDVYDAEIDRINRPDRPVASGRVTAGVAKTTWAVLSGLGVACGLLVSLPLAGIAATSVGLLWFYNAYLKGTAGPGNAIVALVIAAAPLYGALALGAVPPAVWAAVGLTFLLTLAREIAKDVEDVEGDAAEGARTLPVVWGERRASALAAGLVWVTLALLPVPVLWGLGRSFLAYGLATAACLLMASWLLMTGSLGSPGAARRAASRARAWLKGAMVTGIAALLFARLG